jgi:Reverse transcriptase (RNA-dependent DNA polymerase).
LWDILNILLENVVPNGITLLIKDIYSNNFSHIRIQNEQTEKVAITREVRQGGSLSLLLFSIVMVKICEAPTRILNGKGRNKYSALCR